MIQVNISGFGDAHERAQIWRAGEFKNVLPIRDLQLGKGRGKLFSDLTWELFVSCFHAGTPFTFIHLELTCGVCTAVTWSTVVRVLEKGIRTASPRFS